MDVEKVIKDYTDFYSKYLEYTSLCSKKKAELILYTNWDKVNEERKEQGLPKISNQSMKESYVKLDKVYCDLLDLRDKYDVQKQYYYYIMMNMLIESYD